MRWILAEELRSFLFSRSLRGTERLIAVPIPTFCFVFPFLCDCYDCSCGVFVSGRLMNVLGDFTANSPDGGFVPESSGPAVRSAISSLAAVTGASTQVPSSVEVIYEECFSDCKLLGRVMYFL
jgi:hypothetical protein